MFPLHGDTEHRRLGAQLQCRHLHQRLNLQPLQWHHGQRVGTQLDFMEQLFRYTAQEILHEMPLG